MAIIAANLVTAHFGPSASVANAFLFIGLDLTARDRLHETWHKRGLVWKMGALIATGSALSYLLNQNVGNIAVASFVAFALAGIGDAMVYHWMRGKSYLVKINGSNIVGAGIDSLVFPTIAFGGFMPWITLGQLAAKVFGGFFWSMIFRGKIKKGDNQMILILIILIILGIGLLWLVE